MLSTSPRNETWLRLERGYPLALNLEFTKKDDSPVDLTGAVITFDMDQPRRLGGADVIVARPADITEPLLGRGLFVLQGEDLDVAPGEYPFVLTLTQAGGFAVPVVKGTVEIVASANDVAAPEFVSTGAPFELSVQMVGPKRIVVKTNHLPDQLLTALAEQAAANASDAAISRDLAAGYADEAAESAVAAAASATAASGSAALAQAAADAAATRATEADADATTATTMRNEAVAAAGNAQTSETNAETARDQAEAAAVRAEAAADEAESGGGGGGISGVGVPEFHVPVTTGVPEVNDGWGWVYMPAADPPMENGMVLISSDDPGGAGWQLPRRTHWRNTADDLPTTNIALGDLAFKKNDATGFITVYTCIDPDTATWNTNGAFQYVPAGQTSGKVLGVNGEGEPAWVNQGVQSSEVLVVDKLTQAEYDALVTAGTTVATTLYVIVG